VRVLAEQAGATFTRGPRRIPAEVARATIGDRSALLALPMTFMNESGHPVRRLHKYFKAERLVLVHDDIDLPFGKLRLHLGRGPGGHHGVASVVRSMGDAGMWRLKVGVGRPPGRMDPADYVLRRFSKKERADMDLLVVEAADVLQSFGQDGEDAARQRAGEAYGHLFGDRGPR
jgi:PTH1 family peptidyl-tRNA hydrolase